MSFASLGTFSNNVESALIPCYDLNIDNIVKGCINMKVNTN